MKYLVIGDAGSMHIYNFVRTVLLPRNYEVHLLTLSTLPVRESFRAFYQDRGVTVHSVAEKGYRNLDKKDRISRVLQLLYKMRLMADVPKVDVCHVHSVYKTSLLLLLQNRRKFTKLILSYWGGDIEDRSPALIRLREKCFDFADAITVTVKQTYNEFREIYGSKYDEKLSVCRFATDGLNCIKELEENHTRQECRDSYRIPKRKLCVTCGYSAYAAQHQDLCLEALRLLPEEMRKRLFVIVPMQYGRFDTAYIDRVKALADMCDFDCTVLEEYVPFEMSARLAVATDIYLHLRDTDAFSNALKEHVYAGSYVIKGDWLQYPELEEMGASVISIPSFDTLKDALLQAISTTDISEKISLFEPIYALYSTENIVAQWSAVIEKTLK